MKAAIQMSVALTVKRTDPGQATALEIVIYFFPLFSNFDHDVHVDFMSTPGFGIRVMPVFYFVYWPTLFYLILSD
jgi:hypothetical protein